MTNPNFSPDETFGGGLPVAEVAAGAVGEVGRQKDEGLLFPADGVEKPPRLFGGHLDELVGVGLAVLFTLGLLLFGALFVRLVGGFRPDGSWASAAALVAGLLGFAVLVGVTESLMARLRLVRVPQMLVGASVLSVFALVLVLR